MKPIIFIQIDSAYSVDSAFFANKNFQETYFSNKNISGSNLYFITKAKKTLFDINNTTIENEVVKTNFIIGNNEQTIPIEIPIQTITEIIEAETHSKSLFIRKSNDEVICIKPNDIITNYNLDLNNESEIIYIGQSFRMQERIRNHEKIIQAFSGLKDDEDIRLHFINLSFAFPDFNAKTLIHFNKATLNKIDLFGFNYNTLIDLSERILINFFRPELNIRHTLSEIENDTVLCRIIEDYNIDKLICSYDLEGASYQFKSQNQRLNDKIFYLDCSKSPYLFSGYGNS